MARLSPKRSPRRLRRGRCADRGRRLVAAIHAVLNDAIKAGGSTLRDHRRTIGELGYFQHHFRSMTARATPAPPRMHGHRAPLHPERPLDLLVPEVPESNLLLLREGSGRGVARLPRVTSSRRSRAPPRPSHSPRHSLPRSCWRRETPGGFCIAFGRTATSVAVSTADGPRDQHGRAAGVAAEAGDVRRLQRREPCEFAVGIERRCAGKACMSASATAPHRRPRRDFRGDAGHRLAAALRSADRRCRSASPRLSRRPRRAAAGEAGRAIDAQQRQIRDSRRRRYGRHCRARDDDDRQPSVAARSVTIAPSAPTTMPVAYSTMRRGAGAAASPPERIERARHRDHHRLHHAFGRLVVEDGQARALRRPEAGRADRISSAPACPTGRRSPAAPRCISPRAAAVPSRSLARRVAVVRFGFRAAARSGSAG